MTLTSFVPLSGAPATSPDAAQADQRHGARMAAEASGWFGAVVAARTLCVQPPASAGPNDVDGWADALTRHLLSPSDAAR